MEDGITQSIGFMSHRAVLTFVEGVVGIRVDEEVLEAELKGVSAQMLVVGTSETRLPDDVRRQR